MSLSRCRRWDAVEQKWLVPCKGCVLLPARGPCDSCWCVLKMWAHMSIGQNQDQLKQCWESRGVAAIYQILSATHMPGCPFLAMRCATWSLQHSHSILPFYSSDICCDRCGHFGTPELGPRLRSVAVVAPSKYWCVGARLQQQRRKLVQPLVPSDLTPKSSASFCATPSHHRVTEAQKSWCCQNVGRGCVLYRCEGQVSDWSISEREWHLGTSQTDCIWRNGEDWTNVKNRHLNFNIKEMLN